MENWEREYLKWMFTSGNSEEVYAKAAIIKHEHMPERLYKYRSFCKNHINALEQGVLYFTATGSLDDIKEANIVIAETAQATFYQKVYNRLRMQYKLPEAEVNNYDDIIRVICSHFRSIARSNKDKDFMKTTEYKEIKNWAELRFAEDITNLYRINRNMYSVCSFSASYNINGMWSLYGQNHQGFCIEYDFKSLGADNLLTALLFPVIYIEDNRVIVDDIECLDGQLGMLAATLKEKDEWSYQQEWRLLHDISEDKTAQPMPKPTAIYVGQRAIAENIEIIKRYCNNNVIPLYIMDYNQNTNHIESRTMN